jgi:hypothetical protein
VGEVEGENGGTHGMKNQAKEIGECYRAVIGQNAG